MDVATLDEDATAAAAAAATAAAAAAEAADLSALPFPSLQPSFQLLLSPPTGERLSDVGGGTGGSGEGKGFGRAKSSKADSNGLYGVEPDEAAAEVEVMEADAAAETVGIFEGHIITRPLEVSAGVVAVARMVSGVAVRGESTDDETEAREAKAGDSSSAPLSRKIIRSVVLFSCV